MQIILNMSLHVFQWQPFTFLPLLYEYDLHSYELFPCCPVLGNHIVLLIYTAHSKDMTQF